MKKPKLDPASLTRPSGFYMQVVYAWWPDYKPGSGPRDNSEMRERATQAREEQAAAGRTGTILDALSTRPKISTPDPRKALTPGRRSK